MYELLVLAQLARRPLHGYMIAKILGHIMGPFRKAQWGALYPVLNRLESEGLIKAEESGDDGDGRARKVYALTPAGRVRLHDLLMDTEHHLAEYDLVFPHKVTLFSTCLTLEEQLRLARHYWVYCQQNIDHLTRRCQDLSAAGPEGVREDALADILRVMEHRVAHWQLEQRWAEELLAEIMQHQETREVS